MFRHRFKSCPSQREGSLVDQDRTSFYKGLVINLSAKCRKSFLERENRSMCRSSLKDRQHPSKVSDVGSNPTCDAKSQKLDFNIKMCYNIYSKD